MTVFVIGSNAQVARIVAEFDLGLRPDQWQWVSAEKPERLWGIDGRSGGYSYVLADESGDPRIQYLVEVAESRHIRAYEPTGE